MPKMIVSKEAFAAADQETKLLLIYDIMSNHHSILVDHVADQVKTCELRSGVCNNRFLGIERRKVFDTSLSAASGIIGGFIAVIIKSVIWK